MSSVFSFFLDYRRLRMGYPMTVMGEWVELTCIATKTINGEEYEYTMRFKIDINARLILDLDRRQQKYPIAATRGDWIWWYEHWESDGAPYSAGVEALNRSTRAMYTSWISMGNLTMGADPLLNHTWQCSRPLL